MRTVHEVEIKKMLKAAIDALDRAYAPYSKIRTGVCLKGDTGAYYYGAAVENAVLCNSICAERVALLKAIYEGERHMDVLAIVSDSDALLLPCGTCRQVYSEFADDDMPVICGNTKGKYRIITFGELFPTVGSASKASGLASKASGLEGKKEES